MAPDTTNPPKRRMLAEWEPQQACLLAWPHRDSDWRDTFSAIERCYLQLAQAIRARQRLIVLARDHAHRQRILTDLAATAAAQYPADVIIAPHDDTWIRDYGPLAITCNGALRLLDFGFNAWGGKYPHHRDAQACARLLQAAFADMPAESHLDWVLEGGAIDCNGAGAAMIVTGTLLDAARNPRRTRRALTAKLRASLGLTHIHWLPLAPLLGDDTGGHIDTLARFIDADTIAYQGCDDPTHPNHARLQQLQTQLTTLRNAHGAPYALLKLPDPPQLRAHDAPLPASYANFLFINGSVLLPAYDCPQDITAQRLLANALPERRIVPLDTRPLIRQYGGIHCAAMHIPAAPQPGAPTP